MTGLVATYRKLWPIERAQLRVHFLRLGSASRQMRFGHAVSDRYVEDYCGTFHGFATLVYGAFVAGELRAAAELHVVPDIWPLEAELALSVEDAWQDLGLGTELMSRILLAARNRGVGKLTMTCLSENRRMRRIAQKHHARLTLYPDQIDGHIDPSIPDHLSLLNEWIDDTTGVVSYMLTLWPQSSPA
jgi:GNAT superfamily N-acetyltransferase